MALGNSLASSPTANIVGAGALIQPTVAPRCPRIVGNANANGTDPTMLPVL
jgi:hypothetical protein